MKGCLRWLLVFVAGIVTLLSGLLWLGNRLPDVPEEKAVAPYRPSFATLGFGEDDGTGAPEVDYSEQSPVSQQLGQRLRAARFPSANCIAPVEGPNSFVHVQESSQRYVNCLLDAWRPWLRENGASEMGQVQVRHCSLAPWAGTRQCTDPRGVTWDAEHGIYYLTPGMGPAWYGAADHAAGLTQIAAHMVQRQVRTPSDQTGVLLQGVKDESTVQALREDLQNECLAAGILAASLDPAAKRLVAQRSIYDTGGARWDATAQRFWRKQATKGVVGECDEMVAAPKLVRRAH